MGMLDRKQKLRDALRDAFMQDLPKLFEEFEITATHIFGYGVHLTANELNTALDIAREKRIPENVNDIKIDLVIPLSALLVQELFLTVNNFIVCCPDSYISELYTEKIESLYNALGIKSTLVTDYPVSLEILKNNFVIYTNPAVCSKIDLINPYTDYKVYVHP